ncbi:MAG: hypothetical protein AAF493_14140 [Pseudomonadota bacterium]
MNILSNQPPESDSQALWKHFSDTYFTLRLGLSLLALAMPITLYLYGKLIHGLPLQPSMSAYFWAADVEHCATFPMRTIFVGFLLAIGTGLYLYKGLTGLENTLLNLAAICAALVAIFPESLDAANPGNDARLAALLEACPAVKRWATEVPQTYIHAGAAIVLFILLAAVAWFCASKSLAYLPDHHNPTRFERTYAVLAIAMIAFPAIGLGIAALLDLEPYRVFIIETLGVMTFGIYWLVKSRELALSHLESDPGLAIEQKSRRLD